MGDIVDHAKKFSNSTFISTFWDNDDYTFVFHGTPYSTDNPSIYFFVVSFTDDLDGAEQLYQVFMYHRGGGQASAASNRFSTLKLAEQAALLLVGMITKDYEPKKPVSPKRVITPAWRPF